MPGSKRALFAIGGLSAALVVGLTATGAGAATPAPSTASNNSTCPATPGVTPTSVNVGILAPFTGASATAYQAFPQGIQLRIAQQNAKGGVNGRKIVLTNYDDQSNGAIQTSVVNKAVQQDNTFGLIHFSQANTAMTYLGQQNIPVVGMALYPEYGTNKNMFGAASATQSNTLTSLATAQLFADAGATKVALISSSSPASTAGNKALANVMPLAGVTPVMSSNDAPTGGSFDATSLALKVKNSGADGVYMSLNADVTASVLQAFKQQNVQVKKIYAASMTDPVVIAQLGAAAEGLTSSSYGNTPVQKTNIPAIRTFVNGMKAAGYNPYNPFGPIGFMAADTFITGLKLAGKCPTRDAFITNLRKDTNVTAAGLLPVPLNYTPGLTPNGDPAQCTWFVTVKNGQLTADPKPTCGALVDTTTMKIVKPAPTV